MKSAKSIKNIITVAAIILISTLCLNISFAMTKATIIVETANLRKEASEDSTILEQISLNEEVEILEKTNDWYKVKYKGIRGYVRKDLLAVNGEKQEESETQNTTKNETNSQEQASEEKTEETSSNVKNQEDKKENTEQETNEEKKEPQLGKNKVLEDMSIRILPLINASTVGEVKKDEEITVLEIINDWAYIQKENIQGWIILSKLEKVEEPTQTVEASSQETVIKTCYINGSTVNLRKEATTSSESLAKLALNTKVDVLSEENGWSKVKVEDKTGFILSSLLSSTKKSTTSRGSTTSRTKTATTNTTKNTTTAKSTTQKTETQSNTTTPQETSTTSGKGSEVVAYAKKYLGSRYVYGGSSPSGFDCSGFTSYVYKHFGVGLSRTAASQSGNGKSVSSLQQGDLVFFRGSKGSSIGHVGIYIGGNSFIHAATSKTGVIISSLSENYYKTRYVGARRIF